MSDAGSDPPFSHRLTVVGSGDAFSSGGRLQAAFHLQAAREPAILVDCGATVLVGLSRAGLDANRIASIVISHLHGDHYVGIVFFLLHASYVSRRTEPLVIAGPPGTEARLAAAMQALYPGMSASPRSFSLSHVTIEPGIAIELPGFSVAGYEVEHPSGASAYALRLAGAGRIFAYSGDTQWTDVLLAAEAGADLCLMECSSYATDVAYHLSWRRLAQELPRLTARRILLTHMGPQVLANRAAIASQAGERIAFAEDGLVVDF